MKSPDKANTPANMPTHISCSNKWDTASIVKPIKCTTY